MLVLRTEQAVSNEHKEVMRQKIKELTGEDCIILDHGIQLERVPMKKDRAAPLWKRLPWPFRK